MPVSKAQQRATNKYISKAYDRINLTLPKGMREMLRQHADERGESVNALICRAITQLMEQECIPEGGAHPGSGEEPSPPLT